MMDRNEMVSKIIELAKSQVGAAYVWGTWGSMCTPSYRKQYANYTPAKKNLIYSTCQSLSRGKSCEGCKYQGKRAFDCRGLTKWVLKEAGVLSLIGQGADSQWRTAENWCAKGEISKMPDLPGLVLFRSDNGRMGHTGVYIGDGECVHAKGHTSGVVMSGMAGIGWTHWACPNGLYQCTEDELKNVSYSGENFEKGAVSMEVVKKGAQGSAVERLQMALQGLGYDTGTIDGVFGKRTYEALRAFQRHEGLADDGICGQLTWDKLMTCSSESSEHEEKNTIEERILALEKAVRELTARKGGEGYDG